MKKTLITVALAVASMASFGQGYFLFTGTPRTAWDAFSSPGVAKGNSTMNVSFLWAANGATPMVSALGASSGTNNQTSGLGGFTPSQLTTAWTDILTDPNFTVAVNAGTSSTVVGLTTAAGGNTYNASGTFGVTGTAPGANYELYMIGWNSLYATPALAAAGSSAVGWSAPFSYAAVTSIGTPLSMSASGLTAFGVQGVIPEPTTLALAGLGGLSLLLIRRRK